MKTDWRMSASLGVVALVSVGCQVPEDPSWSALEVTDDGIVVFDVAESDSGYQNGYLVSVDDGVTWADGRSQLELVDEDYRSAQTELCLRDSPEVCIRSDGARIVESTNGGQTYETVWELDLRGGWLTRQLDTWEPAEIYTRTVIETASGAVLVSASSIAPIRRAPDGTWSPTESELRTFPMTGTLWALAGMAMLAVAFAFNSVRVQLAVAGGASVYLGTLAMRLSSDEFLVAALLFGASVLVTLVIASTMIAVANRGPGNEVPTGRRDALLRVIPWIVPACILPGSMLAWSRDLLSWDTAEILWVGSLGVCVLASLIRIVRTYGSPVSMPELLPPTGPPASQTGLLVPPPGPPPDLIGSPGESPPVQRSQRTLIVSIALLAFPEPIMQIIGLCYFAMQLNHVRSDLPYRGIRIAIAAAIALVGIGMSLGGSAVMSVLTAATVLALLLARRKPSSSAPVKQSESVM